MAIPQLDPSTGSPCNHHASLDEIERAFGWNYRRRQLLEELRHVIGFLHRQGVQNIWIDGSFVSDKERPGDIDVLYEAPPGAHTDSWGIHSPRRRLDLKKLTRIDLWNAPAPQPVPGVQGATRTLHDLWSTDREGRPTGFVLLEMADDS